MAVVDAIGDTNDRTDVPTARCEGGVRRTSRQFGAAGRSVVHRERCGNRCEQRELARRGYYDGAVDGFYGPKTDAALRDFEQVAGLKPSAEPTEALLQAIVRSPLRSAKPPIASPARPPPGRNELDKPLPSRRVMALQRALAEYGYGQIKPTGIVDAETRAAIEKFERERKLPITGQVSEHIARELAAMTGRPLE